MGRACGCIAARYDERMAAHDYHFVTRWRFDATVGEVAEALSDPTQLPRWWPSVYLQVKELLKGDARGVGKVVRLYTKGYLPYTLRWTFRVIESDYPDGFAIEAWGDFDGHGVWRLRAEGASTVVTYDWKIRANKRLLRWLSFAMKPLFAANHEWAMRMGERSLALELARRKAKSEVERAAVPSPPGPTMLLR